MVGSGSVRLVDVLEGAIALCLRRDEEVVNRLKMVNEVLVFDEGYTAHPH